MEYFMINDDKAQCSTFGTLYTVKEIKAIKKAYIKCKTADNYYMLQDIIYHSDFITTSKFNTYKCFGRRFLYNIYDVMPALWQRDSIGRYII